MRRRAFSFSPRGVSFGVSSRRKSASAPLVLLAVTANTLVSSGRSYRRSIDIASPARELLTEAKIGRRSFSSATPVVSTSPGTTPRRCFSTPLGGGIRSGHQAARSLLAGLETNNWPSFVLGAPQNSGRIATSAACTQSGFANARVRCRPRRIVATSSGRRSAAGPKR
jgi:hypothetical protein